MRSVTTRFPLGKKEGELSLVEPETGVGVPEVRCVVQLNALL